MSRAAHLFYLAPLSSLGLLFFCACTPPSIASQVEGREPSAAPIDVEVIDREAEVTLWKVGPLPVIYQRTPGRETAAAGLYFLLDETTRTSGSADLDVLTLLRAAWRGSQKYSPQEQVDTLRQIASDISVSAGFDMASLSLHSMNTDLLRGLDVMLASARYPSFQFMHGEDGQASEASGVSGNSRQHAVWGLTQGSFWQGHPYQLRISGSDPKLGKYQREDFVRRHAELLDARRMLLVIVGDLADRHLLSAIQAFAGSLEARKAPLEKFEARPRQAREPGVETSVRDSETFFLLGLFDGPPYGSGDQAAAFVAAEVLSHRLFERARREHGLGYIVDADFEIAGQSYGYVYFSSPDPDKTGALALDEIRRLSTTAPTADETAEAIALIRTWRLQGSERPPSLVGRLAASYVYSSNWRTDAETFERLPSVSPDDVSRIIKRYVTNIRFGLVGPHDRIDRSLFGGGASSEPRRARGTL